MSDERHLLSDGPDRTRAVGRALAETLRGGMVIALEGPLGAGKTCFVRGLAEGLGIAPEDVSSPTYVICQEYGHDRPLLLHHVDAYRVSGPEELETIGFEEMLRRDDAITVIEWASRIEPALPAEHVTIEFAHRGPTERELTITGPPAWMEAAALLVDGEPAPAPPSGSCPICEGPVDPASDQMPFCSTRCRTIDLGRWLGGNYRISRGTRDEDE